MTESDPCCPVPSEDVKETKESKEHKKGKENREEREEMGPVGRLVFYAAWVFLGISVAAVYLWPIPEGQKVSLFISAPMAGARELIKFLYEHLVSAMIPAFFLAAAISTFFSKETLIKTMGKQVSGFISYPLAAFAGAILTVCSCGVLPIFMSILQSGAGIGPAITFLFASPAINLISMIYTWKILPVFMLWGRIVAVAFCAICVGIIMGRLFHNETPDDTDSGGASDGKGGKNKTPIRTPLQEWGFFGILVLIMLTSTELFSFITDRLVPVGFFSGPTAPNMARVAGKFLALFVEIVLTIFILRRWFTADERRKWLKRTYRQARRILPMVFLGVFYSGFFGGAPSLVDYLTLLRENTIIANLIASVVGAVLYFGSIVGVNIVDLFMRWGTHPGPALALLLAGPTVSLPSILALVNIIGKKKTAVYFVLVVAFAGTAGLIFGSLPFFASPWK